MFDAHSDFALNKLDGEAIVYAVHFLLGGNFMKYQVLAVGLKKGFLSLCREHFAKKNTELTNVLSISEAIIILKREPVHLLVLDMEYLRSISQCDWIVNIR